MREVQAHGYWSRGFKPDGAEFVPVIGTQEEFEIFMRSQKPTDAFKYVHITCPAQLRGMSFRKAVILDRNAVRYENVADQVTDGPI